MTPQKPAVILFLQGPPSGFWAQLSKIFEEQGARTIRVNFSLGDWLYWRRKGAINYRGSLKDWPRYLERLIEAEGVTDIIYYTDRLPYHVEAAAVAKGMGIPAYSVEFGYLRPDWLTLEKGGMGSYSHFPNSPAMISAIARQVSAPDLSVKYSHTFGQEAVNEVVYNLTSYFGRPFFFRYEADKYYDPFFEYLMWLPRTLKLRRARQYAARIGHAVLSAPFWLLAMQLQSDYQVRANSHYAHLRDMLGEVIGSFARHADSQDKLLIKLHPLDNGYERWDQMTNDLANQHNVTDRVWVIAGGDLGALIDRTKGVIVVNSTVGLHAVQAATPTKVLGMAVYDVAGLTHQGPLDSFWVRPDPVDTALARDLVCALAGTIQVKGNFYNKQGRAVAGHAIATRVLAGSVNEPGAFVDPPPRLAEALRRRNTGASGSDKSSHGLNGHANGAASEGLPAAIIAAHDGHSDLTVEMQRGGGAGDRADYRPSTS